MLRPPVISVVGFFMRFQAQIKEIKLRETASNDAEVRVILITDDRSALELSKYIAQEVVTIQVTSDAN